MKPRGEVEALEGLGEPELGDKVDLRDMGKPGNWGSLGVLEAFVDLQGRGLWEHLETMGIRGPGGIWRAGHLCI